jgi:hypothetical protein
MSYNGKIDFGLLADYDALPDLDAIAEFVDESVDELLAAAREVEPPRRRRAAAKRSGDGRAARAKPAKSARAKGATRSDS